MLIRSTNEKPLPSPPVPAQPFSGIDLHNRWNNGSECVWRCESASVCVCACTGSWWNACIWVKRMWQINDVFVWPEGCTVVFFWVYLFICLCVCVSSSRRDSHASESCTKTHVLKCVCVCVCVRIGVTWWGSLRLNFENKSTWRQRAPKI